MMSIRLAHGLAAIGARVVAVVGAFVAVNLADHLDVAAQGSMASL